MVLAISKDVSTFAQNGKDLNSAFGPVMKKVVHKWRKSNLVDMIDITQ